MKNYKISLLATILLITVFFYSMVSCLPITDTDEYSKVQTVEPTGFAGFFAMYGTWLWLIIIWILPLILTAIYGRRRKISTWGLWFLLTFFTGWLGYIIMIIFNNIRRKEIKISEEKLDEKISEAIRTKKEANKEYKYKEIIQKENNKDEKKYCMKCGIKLPIDATFCKKCGEKTG